MKLTLHSESLRDGLFSRKSTRVLGLSLAAVCFLFGCTVGPNYVRPPADVPTDFKEMGNWKPAHPSDQVTKGNWWEIYEDPQLNALEEQVDVSNQSLRAVQEQYAQARAAIRISRADYYPTVAGGASATRTHVSSNNPLFVAKSPKSDYADYTIPIDASWEPDLWGRVRRTVEASRSEAQATAADVANVSLTLHAELAMDYFQLRGLDAQRNLLDSTVVAYEKALDLTQNRYKAGLASAVDVAQAETQLRTTRAQAIDVGVNRAAFEHAIAVLTGKPPSQFALPSSPLRAAPPAIPPGLPSDLLERRPDIAASERRMQESNAQIGVAKSAYYPLVTLTGSGGFESGVFTTLLQGPSGLWAIGAAASETIFEGGRRHAATAQAQAAYRESIDNYRQTVLSAFQEVEDNLAALRILNDEEVVQQSAVTSAEHSLALSINRYKGGIVNYLEVITAQNAALSDEVTEVSILTRRMQASVLLVKAIGGSWSVSQIPRV
ncbi:MAG: efflux transporter outer membrane subunit [Candidatus Acidiferrales bacterium]